MIKLLRRRTFSKDEGNLDHGPGRLEVVHHPSPAVIDIIAVHGLTHGFKSWTWENKRHNWLEAALARENCGKNARIMTYSYQSNLSKPQVDLRTVLRSRAHDMIYQISELRRKDNTSTRPLVFVAHSLGGLLVKQGLIYSANATKPELRNVEILTGGIAFFGTPNDDIDPGSLATIIKKIISLSSDLENWLKGNDAELDNEAKWLQEDLGAFKPIRSRMKILRVFESKPTSFRGERSVIVSDTGSFKEMEHEQKVVLQRKHTGLVKFGGSDDQEYSKLREQFAQLLAEAQNRAKKKLEDSQIPDDIRTLPFQLPPLNQFRGPRDEIIIRHELTEKMHRLLKEERSTKDFNTMVVHGPPGTGKTTLVRDYSDQRAARNEFVFWMNAENQHTMITGYLNLLQVIIDNYNATQGAKYPANARSKVELVMGMLRPQALLDKASEKLMSPVEIQSVIKAAMNLLMAAESWLLVFDNVRPGFNLLEFVPLSRHGQLILISEDWAHCPWGDSIEIQAWNDQEAADLFNKLMDHSKINQELPPSTGVFSFSGSESKQLIDQLGCQPMVITSAAKHIQATKQTPSAFLSSVSRSSLFLETLGLSLTRRVLEVCSVLSSDAVPYRLLKLVAERYHVIHGTVLSPWSLTDVLEKLQDQSVILRVSGPDDDHGKEDSYVLHQNARQWIKETWIADEQQELRSVWVASYCCTKLLRPQKSTSATLKAKDSEKSMIPHAMACYQMSGRISRNDMISRDYDECRATIEWQVFGKLFMRQGLRREAIECFKLALEDMSQMDFREQVEIRFDLISLYQKEGNIDDCKVQLQQIDIDKVNLEDAGLNRRVELAWAVEAVAEGELEIAEERYQKLGKSQEHDLDPIDTDAIFTVHRLGVILKRLGKMNDAEAKYEQALLSYKIVLGEYNAVTLEAAEELAQILQLRGAFEGAQNHFEWTIDIKRKTLGGQHPSTALSIAKFAALCDMKGDFARADERYEEAFGIMEQSLGCSHPMYLAAMENQALSYRKRANQLFTLTEQGDRQGKESQRGKEKPYSQDYKRAASILSAVMDRKSRNREFYKEASIRATQAKLTKMYETESYFKGATGFSQSAYLAPEDRIDNNASRID